MNDDDLRDMIQRHEGYRPRIYLDSLGYPTGGYGHAFLEGSYLPHDAAEILFQADFDSAKKDYGKLNLDLGPVRRAVIIDMLYNMGLPGLRKFRKMLAAIDLGDYGRAADEMIDSKWFAQVKSRAVELADMMRTGQRP